MSLLISGGADGADTVFATLAQKVGHQVQIYTTRNCPSLETAKPYVLRANQTLNRRYPTSSLIWTLCWNVTISRLQTPRLFMQLVFWVRMARFKAGPLGLVRCFMTRSILLSHFTSSTWIPIVGIYWSTIQLERFEFYWSLDPGPTAITQQLYSLYWNRKP